MDGKRRGRNMRHLLIGLAVLLSFVGCSGSVSSTDSYQSLTKPQFIVQFTKSSLPGKVGNTIELKITFIPGFADSVEQPLADVSLSTDAPLDVFVVPTITEKDFVGNQTTLTMPLLSSLFINRTYSVTVAGKDAIDRLIDPAKDTIDLTAVSGVAHFSPSAPSPAPDHSIYLTTASTPTNSILNLRLMFQGNGDSDSCVKTASFHLLYDDVLGNGSTLDFVTTAKGSFVDCVDPSCFMYNDDPSQKELTVFIAPSGFSCKSASGAVELMTLQFKVSTGVSIPLTFSNVDDTGMDGLRNGAASGSNYPSDQQWRGGDAIIITP